MNGKIIRFKVVETHQYLVFQEFTYDHIVVEVVLIVYLCVEQDHLNDF